MEDKPTKNINNMDLANDVSLWLEYITHELDQNSNCFAEIKMVNNKTDLSAVRFISKNPSLRMRRLVSLDTQSLLSLITIMFYDKCKYFVTKSRISEDVFYIVITLVHS